MLACLLVPPHSLYHYHSSFQAGLPDIDEGGLYAWSDLVGDGDDWLVADILVPGTPAAAVVVVASVEHEARTRSRVNSPGLMNAKIHYAASKPLWRECR